MRQLVITTDSSYTDDAESVSLATLRGETLNGKILRRAFHYDAVELQVPSLRGLPKPMLKLLTARLLSKGTCTISSPVDGDKNVGWRQLARAVGRYLADTPGLVVLPRELNAEVRSWPPLPRPDVSLGAGRQLVIRTDLSFDLKAGGLVSHLRGVLEGLAETGEPARLLTMAPTDAFADAADIVKAPLIERFWNFPTLPLLAANDVFYETAQRACESEPISYVYQRNVAFATSGFRLARDRNVPLVVEYNGSEVWMNRNWGQPLPYEPLAQRVEQANLRAADVVAVVSQSLKDELVQRKIEPDKIVVAPCAANPERFHPDICGAGVRQRLELDDAIVVGFVGSFGRWHGADVLAQAFASLSRAVTPPARNMRLLLIGDGETRPSVNHILKNAGCRDLCRFAGQIPPDQVPAHLAACDILVSPQVENADGSPFFGSPLKLFEYMAMGRAIVASDLGQIGEVLEDGQTGLLVRPGDPDALAGKIALLVKDEPMRRALGSNARAAAVARHSWANHVRAIRERLEERCG